MKQFVLVYLGGNHPASEAEAQQHYKKYVEWLTSLGEAIVIPTIPLKDTTTVSPDGNTSEGGSCQMSGFTIIKADSMEAALSIAKNCPFLDIGGTLEVSEMMQGPDQ